MKEPVQIQLRELTEAEKNVLDHIDYTGCTGTFQVLLAIIALYLWDKGEDVSEHPGNWDEMVLKIRDEHNRQRGIWFYGIIEAWIYYCMEYKGRRVSEYDKVPKEMDDSMTAAECGLTANVLEVWGGITGKKEKDITTFFEYENKKCQREHGCEISGHVEVMYRYVLSALEYLGFTLPEEPHYPKEKVKTAGFDYWELI